MQINTNAMNIVWNGSHTANVFDLMGNEFDVFTFSFEKNKPNATDFLSATISYLGE